MRKPLRIANCKKRLNIVAKNNTYVDHIGNTFVSLTEMCKHWNIKVIVYLTRIKHGWSQIDALTIPVRNLTDHEGNEYDATGEMCKHWNISRASYQN